MLEKAKNNKPVKVQPIKDKKFISFIISLVLGFVTLLLVKNTTLDINGQRLLATLVVIMYIWVTGCMNLPTSALLLLVLSTLSITDFTGTVKGGLGMDKALTASLGGFTGSVPITVIAGTALAAIIKSSGLAERVVYRIMKLVAGKSGKATPSKILGALFLADIPASLMMPSATGRCALYMSVAEGLEEPYEFATLESGKKINPFQKAVWIAVALIPVVMGGAFLTGAEATIMAGGLIAETTMIPQYWGFVFAMMFIPALLVMWLSWYVLKKIFPSTVTDVKLSFIDEKIKSLGKMTFKEKYSLVVLISMIILFLTDKYHGIPATLVLIIAAVVLFLPSVGPGNWKKEGKQIAWDGYFIIGAALGFSSLLTKHKVMDFFAGKIATLGIHGFFLALVIMIAITLIVRLGIASITSAAALLVPFSMIFGQGAGLIPTQLVTLAWVTYVFCRISFFLPHQGAQFIMTTGTGFYEKADLIKAASYITPGAVAIYLIWSMVASPLIIKLFI